MLWKLQNYNTNVNNAINKLLHITNMKL